MKPLDKGYQNEGIANQSKVAGAIDTSSYLYGLFRFTFLDFFTSIVSSKCFTRIRLYRGGVGVRSKRIFEYRGGWGIQKWPFWDVRTLWMPPMYPYVMSFDNNIFCGNIFP